MTRTKQEKNDELTLLGEWCHAIVEYLGEIAPQSPIQSQLKAGIERALEAGNLRAMRMASRDLAEWARELNNQQRAGLDRRLRERFGRGLDDEEVDELQEIRHIVRRGSIANPDEYRLVESRVANACGDKSREDEIGELNKLLADYHKLGSDSKTD